MYHYSYTEKKLSVLKKTLIFCAFLVFPLTADYAKFSREIGSIGNICLFSVNINKTCMEKKRDKTKYINIGFAGRPFLLSLISNYNRLDTNCTMQAVSLQPDQLLLKAINSNTPFVFSSNNIWFPYNLDYNRMSSSEIKTMLNSLSGQAYAVLDLKISIWAQEARGQFSVFNADKKPIWTQRIKKISTYIIQDPQSPYITEYENYFNQAEKQISHKTEIIKMLGEIALETAKELKKNRWKYLKLEPRKKLLKTRTARRTAGK
ncbi:MAG TPA: hypothetical protein DC049_14590 [Spirochaetia bacterium]|nr:hypothetical protein [Spirochaetia bacterium]